MCKEARKIISVPYLYVTSDTKVSIGYFTLSSGSLERDYLTPRPRKEVPYSIVPCILHGRIAVCKLA